VIPLYSRHIYLKEDSKLLDVKNEKSLLDIFDSKSDKKSKSNKLEEMLFTKVEPDVQVDPDVEEKVEEKILIQEIE